MMNVDEIMTGDPITLGPDSLLSEAGTLMLKHRIRHIPVLNEAGELAGLVTQRDLLAAGEETTERSVGSVTRDDPHTIGADADMRSAGLLMQKYKIGSLPVVRDNRLVGIVTDTDYVSLAINLLEQLDEVSPVEEEDFDEMSDLEEFSAEEEL